MKWKLKSKNTNPSNEKIFTQKLIFYTFFRWKPHQIFHSKFTPKFTPKFIPSKIHLKTHSKFLPKFTDGQVITQLALSMECGSGALRATREFSGLPAHACIRSPFQGGLPHHARRKLIKGRPQAQTPPTRNNLKWNILRIGRTHKLITSPPCSTPQTTQKTKTIFVSNENTSDKKISTPRMAST